MNYIANDITNISGTISNIIDDGQISKKWKGLVVTHGRNLPIYVESDIIADTAIGDSVRLYGQMYERKNIISDGYFIIDTQNARTYKKNILSNSQVYSALGSSEMATTVSDKISEHNINSFVALNLNNEDLEPEIKWGLDIFNSLSIKTLNGPLIIAQPSTIYESQGDSIWSKIKSISKFHFFDNNSPLERMQKSYVKTTIRSEWLDQSPEFIEKKDANKYFENYKKQNPSITKVRKHTGEEDFFPQARDFNGGFLIPYNLNASSATTWQGIAGSYKGEFFSKIVIPPEEYNKIIFAHEMSHAHSENFKGDIVKMEVSTMEAFADAGALMVYLLNGGKEEYALAHASARSIDFLMGGTYQTGPSCYKAIEKARELKERYGDTPVTIDVILQEADLITEQNSDQSQSHVLSYVKDCLAQNTEWKLMNRKDMIEYLENLRRDAINLPLPEEMRIFINNNTLDKQKRIMSDQIDFAIKAIKENVYIPSEVNKNPDLIVESLKKSMEDSIKYLTKGGMSAAIPELLISEKAFAQTIMADIAPGMGTLLKKKRLLEAQAEGIVVSNSIEQNPFLKKIEQIINRGIEKIDRWQVKLLDKLSNTFYENKNKESPPYQIMSQYSNLIDQYVKDNSRTILKNIQQQKKSNKTPNVSGNKKKSSPPIDSLEAMNQIINLLKNIEKDVTEIYDQEKRSMKEKTEHTSKHIHNINFAHEQIVDIMTKIIADPHTEQEFNNLLRYTQSSKNMLEILMSEKPISEALANKGNALVKILSHYSISEMTKPGFINFQRYMIFRKTPEHPYAKQLIVEGINDIDWETSHYFDKAILKNIDINQIECIEEKDFTNTKFENCSFKSMSEIQMKKIQDPSNNNQFKNCFFDDSKVEPEQEAKKTLTQKKKNDIYTI